MIFHTDRFIPAKSNACARGFVILIRPKYLDDRGILAHEKVHVKQFLTRGLIVHSLRYALSKAYRYASEVEAFREQARWYLDDRRKNYAYRIAHNYGLDVTEAEALEALIK